MKKVSVIKESSTGKNITFKDNYTGKIMTKQNFVKNIENGRYDTYHIRVINNDKIPVSNPDKSKRNNLG